MRQALVSWLGGHISLAEQVKLRKGQGAPTIHVMEEHTTARLPAHIQNRAVELTSRNGLYDLVVFDNFVRSSSPKGCLPLLYIVL